MKEYCLCLVLVCSFLICSGQKDSTQYFSYSIYTSPKVVSQLFNNHSSFNIDFKSGYSLGLNAHYNLYGSAIKVGLSTTQLNFGFVNPINDYHTHYYRSDYKMRNLCFDLLAKLKIGDEFKSHGYFQLGFSSYIYSVVEGNYYTLRYMQTEETLLKRFKFLNNEVRASLQLGFGYQFLLKEKNFINVGIVGEVCTSELRVDWEKIPDIVSRIYSVGLQVGYEFQ